MLQTTYCICRVSWFFAFLVFFLFLFFSNFSLMLDIMTKVLHLGGWKLARVTHGVKTFLPLTPRGHRVTPMGQICFPNCSEWPNKPALWPPVVTGSPAEVTKWPPGSKHFFFKFAQNGHKTLPLTPAGPAVTGLPPGVKLTRNVSLSWLQLFATYDAFA